MRTKEEVFQQAKRIVLEGAVALEEFQSLARKIEAKWKVKLINGDVYEYVQLTNPMRLRLIFHADEDLHPLPKLWNERQEKIGVLFIDILQELNIERYAHYDLSQLEVDYFLLEELGFQECVDKLDTARVRREFEQENIWGIQKFWNYCTVFFHTNQELTEKIASGISRQITASIQELAKANDPFGLLDTRKIEVKFDSKENFDRIGGYNYYR